MLHLSIHVGYAALQNIYKEKKIRKIKSKNITLKTFLEKVKAIICMWFAVPVKK